MKHIIAFFLLCSVLTQAQNYYPQDYFQSPLDIPLILSGTFAELRSNHFHSGLDIKTKQRQGLNVYASAEGYVSRIKIAHFGYGKALYVTHPNGYVTVYAHLQKFSPTIEAYIKAKQYENESYEIEVFPNEEDILVAKKEVIAYSGNSGGSGGPHLHFEIRDNMERPINPMLFGIEVKDTKRPIISDIYAYPMDEFSHVNLSNKKQKLRLIPKKNGRYEVEKIKAYGRIGFAIASIDKQDLAANKNGVYNIKTFYNGVNNFELDFKRFSFDETKHLNRLIDYKHYKTKKQRLQKLFIDSNNPLSLYNNIIDDGFITVEDSTSTVYKVNIKDYKGNEVWLDVNIKGFQTKEIECEENIETPHYIFADQKTELTDENISVYIPANTFYEDFYLDYETRNDTIKIHEPHIALQKSLSITYDISHYKTEDTQQLYIARLVGWNNFPIYSNTKREDNKLITWTKNLGTYALAIDKEKPSITPINFQNNKWLSKYRFLKIKIEDKESGISNYRATINGKWVLMEYDYKTKLLVYDFNDHVINETKNNLKLIVTDNVGNNSTFETTFFRK